MPPDRVMLRRGAYLAAALVLLGVLLWALFPKPLRVELATAQFGPFEESIEEEGQARVIERFVIAAPVAGLLQRPELQVGDRVQTGDLLAVIRPPLASLRDARSAAELRERVAAAEASHERALAGVEQARVAHLRALAEQGRNRELFEQGFVSARLEEQTRLAEREAQQALRASQLAAQVAEHEVRAARAAAREGVAARLDEPPPLPQSIRAQRPGTVLRRFEENETVVAAGAPLLELGDLRHLEVVVDLLSQQALRVSPGARVWLSAGMGTVAFEGRVRRVEPVARTRISALGVEEQRTRVLIDLVDAPQAGLGDGWRLETRIVLRSQERVLRVPVGAVFRDPGRIGSQTVSPVQGGNAQEPDAIAAPAGPGWEVGLGSDWGVYAVVRGRAERRPVTLLGRNAWQAWVEGIDPGTSVIVYPPETVREGSRVSP